MVGILRSLPLDVRQKIERSSAYLMGQRSFLEQYVSVYDLVEAMEPDERIPELPKDEQRRQKSIQAVAHHLGFIVNEVLRQLWLSGFLLGSTTLEEILYDLYRDSKVSNPVRQALAILRESGVHRPGVLIYPLHSIGIAGAGLFRAFSQAEVNIHLREAGMLVSPQTNSLGQTISFRKHALPTLGVVSNFLLT